MKKQQFPYGRVADLIPLFMGVDLYLFVGARAPPMLIPAPTIAFKHPQRGTPTAQRHISDPRTGTHVFISQGHTHGPGAQFLTKNTLTTRARLRGISGQGASQWSGAHSMAWGAISGQGTSTIQEHTHEEGAPSRVRGTLKCQGHNLWPGAHREARAHPRGRGTFTDQGNVHGPGA